MAYCSLHSLVVRVVKADIVYSKYYINSISCSMLRGLKIQESVATGGAKKRLNINILT